MQEAGTAAGSIQNQGHPSTNGIPSKKMKNGRPHFNGKYE
jgi:hypothetical protein